VFDNSLQLAIRKIGANIRLIRQSKSLSLTDLASSCNMEKTNLSRIELGKTNVSVGILLKISQSLNVPLSDFFKGL
jgi:transcriptional regulator with XRE-family HTH domain